MKNKLTEWSDKLKAYTDRNAPSLLTGVGVAGVFVTAYMAYKAGPKAKEIIERHKAHPVPETKEEKRTEIKELVKEIAPVVLPTIGMAVATSACIIGANSVSSRRLAVLSAAYSMSESALKEYQAKVVEMVDTKKVQKIKESIAQDKLDRNPPRPNQEILMTGDGDVLCMDCYSGRYFRSNAQKIGQAINELSADLQTDMYVSLNDLYGKLNIPSVPMGDDFGWNVDDLVRGQLTIDVSAHLTPDKQPCLVVDYDVFPREDFRRLH